MEEKMGKWHIKRCVMIAVVIAISSLLGLMILRSSNVRDIHGYNERHVKITVGSKLLKQENMFHGAHRTIFELLGSKMDNNTDGDVEITMRKRREHLRNVCSLRGKKEFTIGHVEKQLAFYENINTLYCPVAKVASKFLSRMLHVLNLRDFSSPFDFRDSRPKLISKKIKNMTTDERTMFMEKVKNFGLSFIFARNPYKRIFSSYVDKFLGPNYEFWGYAKTWIRNQTEGCGKDLKFSELVKHLISTEPNAYEDHFRPVTTQCDLCNVEYLVIGKVETFKTDIYHILNLTKNPAKILFKDFAQENSIHYIIYNSIRTHGMLKNLLSCATHHQIYQRLWRQLQISGMIEIDNSYPLTPEVSKTLSLTSLTNLLLDGYHRSSSGARSNMNNAYLQAYSEVPLEDLEKLRLKFLEDFLYFEYESRPSDLFLRGDSISKKKGGFDFFDLLKES